MWGFNTVVLPGVLCSVWVDGEVVQSLRGLHTFLRVGWQVVHIPAENLALSALRLCCAVLLQLHFSMCLLCWLASCACQLCMPVALAGCKCQLCMPVAHAGCACRLHMPVVHAGCACQLTSSPLLPSPLPQDKQQKARSWFGVGVALHMQGEHETAAQAFQKAAKLAQVRVQGAGLGWGDFSKGQAGAGAALTCDGWAGLGSNCSTF